MNPAIIGAMANNIYLKYKTKKLMGSTIYMSCRRCNYTGSHEFRRIAPSLFLPFAGKNIFLCKNCSSEMLEDGTIITTLWERIEAFFKAGELKDAIWELETILASNQKLSVKDREEIIRLKNELGKVNADVGLLKRQIKELIDRVQKAA